MYKEIPKVLNCRIHKKIFKESKNFYKLTVDFQTIVPMLHKNSLKTERLVCIETQNFI